MNDITSKKSSWNKGIPHTEEQKRKISLSKKGQKAWNKGIKGSIKPNKTSFKKGQTPYNKNGKINLEEHPNYGMAGKHHTEDSKKRMSLARLGVAPANKGIKVSPDRLCKHCGKVIPPKKDRSYNKNYCSRKCSGLARRKRITAICKTCGISFDYSPGHQKNRRFCSKKCQLEFGRTTLYCKQCGKGFNKIKYWAGKQIYCSKKCQTASPEWRAKIREERWNQKFPTKDSLPERILQQFCLELGLDYETDKRISNIKHRYPADLYLSKFNMIIEADGDYWHSWSKKPDHKIKDKYRNKELLEKGYIVLRLKEKDIKKMTKEDFQKKIEEALNRKNKKKQS